jgi:hypothetical protein
MADTTNCLFAIKNKAKSQADGIHPRQLSCEMKKANANNIDHQENQYSCKIGQNLMKQAA